MSDRTREMATVRENSRILDGYYKMTLHAPVIAQRCRPGQFVFIRVGSGTAAAAAHQHLRSRQHRRHADTALSGGGHRHRPAVRRAGGPSPGRDGPHRHAVPRGGRAGDTGSRRHGGGAPVYAGPGTA